MDHSDVVIVGAGHAGAQAAVALRQKKFDGSIRIIGDETHLPYERPPLSKDYLAGDKEFERMLLRPAKFWDEKSIVLTLCQRVTGIDAHAKTVETDTGARCSYTHLIWAAGGTPRQLTCPGSDLAGQHVVRGKDDIDALQAALSGPKPIVIVGGGYIGLEAAAALTKLGHKVTVLEAQDRLLKRVAGEAISAFYLEQHQSYGVDVRLNCGVARFEGSENGHIQKVVLEDGSEIETDTVVTGIGIVPNVGPLIAAGANGDNGVDVNAFCRTSLPDVYAIGDCAKHANSFAGNAEIRLESVQNANDQAICAATAIAGEPKPYAALPWFWSDQYDLKLQTVGLNLGYDQQVLRGDPSSKSFSVIYLQNKQVIALDCVNAARDFAQGRKLVQGRLEVDPAGLADADQPLKSLI